MKKMILILAASISAAALAATTAGAGRATVSRDAGYTVDTYFTTTVAGVLTNVNVYAGDGLTKSPGGRAELSRPLSVFVLQKDVATDEILLDVNAYVQLAPGVLRIDPQIRRARLRMIVEGVDGVSGRAVQIALVLDVTGVGPLERAHNRVHYVGDELTLNAHGNSRVRYAEAHASLSIDSFEYAPEPAFFAYLSKSSGGDVWITH